MDDILTQFESLKISALSKAKKINSQIEDAKSLQCPTQIISPSEKYSTATPKKHATLNNSSSPNAYKQILNTIEQHRQQTVSESAQKHAQRILNFSKQQQELQRQTWSEQQIQLIVQMEQIEYTITEKLKEYDMNSSKEHEQIQQYYKQVEERRSEQNKALQAKENIRKQFYFITEHINKLQINYKDLCNYAERSSFHLPEIEVKLQKQFAEASEYISQYKMGNIKEQDIISCQNLIKLIEAQFVEFQKNISSLLKAREAEIETQKEQQRHAAEAATAAQINEIEPKIHTSITENIYSTKISQPIEITNKPLGLESHTSKSAFKNYIELQKFTEDFQNRFKPLLDDTSLKTFKFDCKKAVNIPVNAISAVNRSHLIDKFNKLFNLLKGNDVIIGDARVNASRIPNGIQFSMDLLAKKFIQQGDLMVSSKPDSAYCYATVIITLWNAFPELGKLVLCYFYNECPYLVPLYPPKLSGQSDEEYYKTLGYKYKDNCVERQDKFLKRMSGILRLYFAILIATPKSGHGKNPYGIEHGWNWLATILNMEPQIDITSTALFVFFEVCGYKMLMTYGKQFRKVINYIANDFINKLRKYDSGGPLARLEAQLQDYNKSGSFREQKSIPINFW